MDEILIVPAEQKHLSAAGDIAVVAWSAIHDAYIQRIGELLQDLYHTE